MSYALRDYQVDLVAAARAQYAAGKRRVVAVSPTGSGKTVFAAAVVQQAVAKGSRVVFLAHRAELIGQASRKLAECGVLHGTIQAGTHYDGRRVQVASIPTLARRSEVPPADLVVVDETHHVNSASWSTLMGRYPTARVLGLTATPFRLDGRGLGEHYDALVSSVTVADLIQRGYLVAPITYSHPAPDLSGVRKQAGDYVAGEVSARCDQPRLIGDIVGHWKRLGQDRTTVAFCASVAHAEHVAAAFQTAGIPAAAVDGAMDRQGRSQRLDDLAAGRLRVVTNVGILTEGWDLPACGCVIQARPTASLSLYLQIVGRGLRSLPGKRDCIVLDHAGNTLRHGFVTDPIAYSLDGIRARSGSAASIRTCPQCAGAFPAGTPVCALCGYVWPPPAPAPLPTIAAGDLQELRPGDVDTPPEKNDALQKLIRQGQEKGYAKTWAYIKFHAMYGHWPNVRKTGKRK